MKHFLIFAIGCCHYLLIVGSASAQVFYEPVQYQYGAQRAVYYGGSDPSVLARATFPVDAAGRFGRVNGFAYTGGDVLRHREVTSEPLRVFTDAIPGRNAALYGFTIDDARNEAYANAPRYFRKSELLATAERRADGTWVVPAQPRAYRVPSIVIVAPRSTTTDRTTRTTPLIILPKQAMKLQNGHAHPR